MQEGVVNHITSLAKGSQYQASLVDAEMARATHTRGPSKTNSSRKAYQFEEMRCLQNMLCAVPSNLMVVVVSAPDTTELTAW